MLTNFLTKAPLIGHPFWRAYPISKQRLQEVSNGLFKNLSQSCSNYIEGLIDLDEQFIKNTSSPYLYKILQPELRELKTKYENSENGPHKQLAKKLRISTAPESQSTLNLENSLLKYNTRIMPFVVFNSKLQQRLVEHPFENLQKVTRNRYIRKPFSFGNMFKDITYCFKCQFLTEKDISYPISITFEGNIEKEQFYVIDLGEQLENNQNAKTK